MAENYKPKVIGEVNKPAAKPQVQKVVKGKTKVKKESEIAKIGKSIISDECKSIKEYAIYDVLVPVVKDTISQLVKGAIDMIFYGEVKPQKGGSRGGSGYSKVSYSDYYDRPSRKTPDRRLPERASYDNVSFESRNDAIEVLERMDEIVEQYGVVRVADLFEMAGMTGNGPTDNNYGWYSTKNASVERDRYGDYYIKIGRPAALR